MSDQPPTATPQASPTPTCILCHQPIPSLFPTPYYRLYPCQHLNFHLHCLHDYLRPTRNHFTIACPERECLKMIEFLFFEVPEKRFFMAVKPWDLLAVMDEVRWGPNKLWKSDNWKFWWKVQERVEKKVESRLWVGGWVERVQGCRRFWMVKRDGEVRDDASEWGVLGRKKEGTS